MFTSDAILANEVAKKWKALGAAAFQNGKYAPTYINTFYEIMKPKYGTINRTKKLLRTDYSYPISSLGDEIDQSIEKEYFDFVMNAQTAYYYAFAGSVLQGKNIDDYMKSKDNLMDLLTAYADIHPGVDIEIIIPHRDNMEQLLKQL